jgi:hypothetical protein
MTSRFKLRLYSWVASWFGPGPRRRLRVGAIAVFVGVAWGWLLLVDRALLPSPDAPSAVRDVVAFLALTTCLIVGWVAASHRRRRRRVHALGEHGCRLPDRNRSRLDTDGWHRA